MALSSDRIDNIEVGTDHHERYPVKANAVIFIGAMVQADDTGFMTPVGDPGLPTNPRAVFVAHTPADATGMSDGQCYVMCIEKGKVEFPAGAVLAAANRGRVVYATVDDTFTLTPNNSKVGTLAKVEGGRARVILEG